jgi:hypothetical protein
MRLLKTLTSIPDLRVQIMKRQNNKKYAQRARKLFAKAQASPHRSHPERQTQARGMGRRAGTRTRVEQTRTCLQNTSVKSN